VFKTPIDPVTYFGFKRSRKTRSSSKVSTVQPQETLKDSIQKSYGKDYIVTKNADGSFTVTKVPQEYLKFKNKRELSKNVTDTYSSHTIKLSSTGQVLEETYRGVYDRQATRKKRSKAVYVKRYVNYSTGVERQYKTRSVGRYGRDKVKLAYERTVTGKTRSFTVRDQSEYRQQAIREAQAAQSAPLSPEQVSIIKTYGRAGVQRESFKKAAPTRTYTESEFKAILKAEKAARVATTTAQQSALRESQFRYGRLSEKVGRYQEFKDRPKSEIKTFSYQLPLKSSRPESAFKTAVKGALYPVAAPLSFAKNVYTSASEYVKQSDSEIVKGARYGLKTVGYIVGQPFVFAGQQIETFGDYYKSNPIGQDKSGASVAAVGQFVTGYGKGFKDEPTTALVSYGVGSVIGFGVPAVKGVVGTTVNKLKIPIAASVRKYAPKVSRAARFLLRVVCTLPT